MSKTTILPQANTVGELRTILEEYPDETPFGFRNQVFQELAATEDDKETSIFYQPRYDQKERRPSYYVILAEIMLEFDKAEAKHPDWPSDILHQIAIVNEESGEATRACLHYVYEKGRIDEVKKELVQTAAMCIRMLDYIKYEK